MLGGKALDGYFVFEFRSVVALRVYLPLVFESLILPGLLGATLDHYRLSRMHFKLRNCRLVVEKIT